MAVTVSTTAMRSWSDIVKGSASHDMTSAKSESIAVTDASASTIAKRWNLCADEFVPAPAATVSSNFNVNASEFVLTEKDNGPNMISAYCWCQAPTMNANAKEFTPSTRTAAFLNASAKEFTPSNAGLGLAECGQTVEGWQSLAKKMGEIVSVATQELLPVSNLNINSINPAFLSDDDSDTETIIGLIDDIDNDADNESSVSIGNHESSESIVGSLDEFDCSDVEKEKTQSGNECAVDIFAAFAVNSKMKEISEGNQESDRDTVFNESVLSGHECSSDVDPQASSVDDSTSLAASSDLEIEDVMNIPMFQVKAPPGLSLPPWKVPSGVAKAASVSQPLPSSTPLKLPAWRRGFSSKSSSESEGEDSPAVDVPEKPQVDAASAKAPPGLGLPPWRVARG